MTERRNQNALNRASDLDWLKQRLEELGDPLYYTAEGKTKSQYEHLIGVLENSAKYVERLESALIAVGINPDDLT